MPRRRTGNEDPILSAAAAIRSARRQRFAHVCEVCGAAFTGVRQARFCSHACQQRAHYQRHKRPPLP